MRILLTGSKGQLAQCFRDRLPDKWEVISTDSASLDITDATAVFNMVQSFQPDAIVNAAAYTAVDKAEREYRKAFAVNASAVHNLAAAAYEAKVRPQSSEYLRKIQIIGRISCLGRQSRKHCRPHRMAF